MHIFSWQVTIVRNSIFVFLLVVCLLFLVGCAAIDPEAPTKIPTTTEYDGSANDKLLPLTGKTVVFLGDSIFGNNDSSSGIVHQFAHASGATCYNFAFGGTKAKSRISGDEWSTLDGESLVQAIVSGDYTKQQQALTTIETSMVDLFSKRLTAMETFDWSAVDYVICNWGTNDWFSGESITNYTAAMHRIFQTLHAKYPHIHIIKATPTPRFIANEQAWINSNEWHQKYTDHTLSDFVQTDLYTDWGPFVTVINCYDIGITAENRTQFFNEPDCTHPNNKGNGLVAACLVDNFSILFS